MFAITDVTEWPVRVIEADGADPKPWLCGPTADWMFKPAFTHPQSGNRQGEDWAEKIVAEIGALIGVPTAISELAVRDGVEGVLSRDARPTPDWEQQPGDILLEEVISGFNTHRTAGYSLGNIRAVLADVQVPPGFRGPETFSGFDVLAGFLVLDALVGNRDRHARNWSVLRSPEGDFSLMASYDHASSLGFNLTDAYRRKRLDTDPSLVLWCRKGTAYRFRTGAGNP